MVNLTRLVKQQPNQNYINKVLREMFCFNQYQGKS